MASVPEFGTEVIPEFGTQVKSSVPEFGTPADSMSATEAFARGIGGGMTFDFDDELAGAIKAAKEAVTGNNKEAFGDAYARFRDQYRAANKQALEEHPVAYLGGAVAGGAATSLIPGAGATKVGQLLTGSKLGAIATQGAISAVGRTEDFDPSGIVKDFALGLGIYGIGKAAGKGVSAGVSKLKGATNEKVAAEAAQTITKTKAWDEASQARMNYATAEDAMFNVAKTTDDITPDQFRKLNEAERTDLIKKGMEEHPNYMDIGKLDDTSRKEFNKRLRQEESRVRERLDIKEPTAADQMLIKLEAADNLASAMDENKLYIIRDGAEAAGMTVPEYLGYSILRREGEAFRKKMSGFGSAKDYAAQNGEESLRGLYNSMRQTREALARSGKSEIPLSKDPGALYKVATYISDAREVASILQRKHNIDLIDSIDNMSLGYNKLNVSRIKLHNILSRAGGLDEVLERLRPEERLNSDRWLMDLSRIKDPKEFASALAKLSPEQQAAVKEVKSVTDWLAEEYGVLQKSKDPLYIPLQLRDQRFIHRTIEDFKLTLEKKFGTTLDKMDNTQFGSMLRDSEGKAFYNGISWLSDSKPQNALEFYTAVNSLNSQQEMARSLVSKSGHLMRRLPGADIPQWLVEENVPALLRKYAVSVGRHRYLAEDMDKISEIANLLAGRGDIHGAEYLKDLVSDVKGVPREKLSGFLITRGLGALSATFDRMALRAKSDRAKQFYTVLAGAPEKFYGTINNVYPYFLGGRPSVALRNATQPFLLTLPHLGNTTYNAGLAARAAISAAGDLRSGKGVFRRLASSDTGRRLVEQGILPPEHSREFYETVARRSTDIGLGRTVQRAVKKAESSFDALNEWVMGMFEMAEHSNRITTYHMARNLVSDLAEGNADAYKTLVRAYDARDVKKIQSLVSAGRVGDAQDLAAIRLISKSQFNYNKANASEFARQFGPVFSMFTKWPSAIGGDIYSTLTDSERGVLERARRLGGKYLAPMGLLIAADLAWSDREKDDAATNWVVGKGPLSGASPLSSVLMFKPSNLTNPPAIEGVVNALKAGVGVYDGVVGDTDITPAAVNTARTLIPFVPGGVVYGIAADLDGVFDMGLNLKR